MGPRHSLRSRVAITFAWFGALVSLILAVGLYVSAHDLGQRLIEETLQAELQDYLARRARNPHSPVPATLTLSGYVRTAGTVSKPIPERLQGLGPGFHQILLGGVSYRALVADRGSTRYYLLFNEVLLRRRETRFLFYLAAGVAVMTLISAMGGLWLARRVIAPVTDLASRVAGTKPGGTAPPLASGLPHDEVGELALSFDRYLARLEAFMARERAFTADVSHELRTPLAVIRGAVEVLEEDPALGPAQRARIARIERASRDMAELSSALLHLGREEDARERGDAVCYVADVVRDSVDKHRPLALSKGIELNLDLRAGPKLTAEKTLASVVVGNLVRNAIAHTESGRVDVALEASHLSVTDTGPGIAEADQELVFRRYYRGTGSSGTGIGLSLVKRICDLYGWKTAIRSVPGQGTAVRLAFTPAAEDSADPVVIT